MDSCPVAYSEPDSSGGVVNIPIMAGTGSGVIPLPVSEPYAKRLLGKLLLPTFRP